MALNVGTARTALAAAYAAGALYAEASSATTAGTSAGAALSGVSRVPLTWTAGAAGTTTSNAPFTGLTSGQVLGSVNVWSASTGGTLFDTIEVADITMPAPGSANVALTVSIV